MDKNELSRIADLAGSQNAPRATVLVPDVRSGSTFSYSERGDVNDPIPMFLVVWFYTVRPDDRRTFAGNIANFEDNAANLPPPGSGVTYRGTYSVSVSSAAPKFEYRTVWGLTGLDKLQDLNDYINSAAAGSGIKTVLSSISKERAMRTEIMGRTKHTADRT